MDSASPPSRKPLAHYQEMIRDSRPELSEDSAEFRGALLLLLFDAVGTNVDRLVRRSGLPREFVARGVRRLIDNGWLAQQEANSETRWCERPPSCRHFWLDVEVLLGLSHRRITETGEAEWAPVGEWVKDYDYQGARSGAAGIHNQYRKVTLHDPEPVLSSESDDEESAPELPEAAKKNPDFGGAEAQPREAASDSDFLGSVPEGELLGTDAGEEEDRTSRDEPARNDADLLVSDWSGANWLS